MRNLTRVCHLGNVDTQNPSLFRPANESYEGNGLSISVTPAAWEDIASLGGKTSYILEKENPNFFDAYDDDLRKEALKWCLDQGFIVKHLWWRSYFENEDGEESYFEFRTKEEAENESEKVKSVTGYAISGAMLDYFEEDMIPPHIYATDYAIIWFAEAVGCDGVWWEESSDQYNLSAPRGVIFQHKLEEWKIIKGEFGEDHE